MIEFAWFVIGLTFGVVGTLAGVTYLGHREIKKRSKRSSNWQKAKKKLDQDISEEWGI